MTDTAIRVENLSKLYDIGKAQKRHDTLRDAIVGAFNVSASEHSNDDTIWALKDVSFEVQRGEVVGTLAPDGATSCRASRRQGRTIVRSVQCR